MEIQIALGKGKRPRSTMDLACEDHPDKILIPQNPMLEGGEKNNILSEQQNGEIPETE